jgi:hypothetical protein
MKCVVVRRLLIAVLTGATLLHPPALVAQNRATAFVPVDHWSVPVVDRLHALGLAPRGTPRGQRSRTTEEIREVLQLAANSGHAAARGYLERFTAEFDNDSVPSVIAHASVAGGVGMLKGDVAHGIYSTWGEENWTGAIPREDLTTATGQGAILLQLGTRVAFGADASRDPLRTRLDELYGIARFGPAGLWGGRRILGFGPGTSSIVLSGTAPVDGAGISLLDAVTLPGPLRYLGPMRVDVAAAVLERNGPIEQPFFVLTRGSIEPHPRLGLAVMRAGMIGRVSEEVSALDVLYFLVGGQTDGSEGDNQVVAVEMWFRPPTGSLPLLLYLEWGSEDSAGAWRHVPGIVAGVEVPSLPGLRWASLLIERASFGYGRFGNPPWYRHIGYHEGWSTRGELLGHSLGGHGRESLVQVRGSLLDARLQLLMRAFFRNRGFDNTYAPQRAGRSTGVTAQADVQLRSGVALHIAGTTESGSGWRKSEFSSGLRVYLPQGMQ